MHDFCLVLTYCDDVWLYFNQHELRASSEKHSGRKSGPHARLHCSRTPGSRGRPWGLTIGAKQALELGQQPNGVELPQEAVVMQAVPQLDDEAADESSQLWGRHEAGLLSGGR